MKRPLALLVVLAACSDKSSAPAPETPSKSPPPAPAPVAETRKAAPPPTDPRLTELFAAAKDCKWSDEGILQSCPPTEKIRELTFQNQNDSKLGAACMAAFHDSAMPTRLMAAACLNGLNGMVQEDFAKETLDAIEAEKETPARNALAFSMGHCDPSKAKLDERVIALARKFAGEKDGEFTASSLLDMLFPQYLIGSNTPPPKAAGDLALEMARKNGTRMQVRALEVMALLKDRMPDVCAAYGEVIAGLGDDWAKGVYALADAKDACPAQVDASVDAMIKAMTANKYNTYEYQATKRYLERVPLTAAQQAKLVPPCEKFAAKADGVWKDDAKEIATLCHKKTN
jgi:hypothetical protein